jgi:hypothetical protein
MVRRNPVAQPTVELVCRHHGDSPACTACHGPDEIMLEALGSSGQQASSDCASAGYRGQIGLPNDFPSKIAPDIFHDTFSRQRFG